MINFIKEIVEDEGEYYYIKKFYNVTTDQINNLIILELKENQELYTDITKIIIQYSKASFENPLGRLEYYEAYEKKEVISYGYYHDPLVTFFKNLQ